MENLYIYMYIYFVHAYIELDKYIISITILSIRDIWKERQIFFSLSVSYLITCLLISIYIYIYMYIAKKCELYINFQKTLQVNIQTIAEFAFVVEKSRAYLFMEPILEATVIET